MKTADFSKTLFSNYDGLYICHFLWLQHVSIKSNDWGYNFALPKPKKSPKKPSQKWTKCCMKAPIRQFILKTSLFIVHFSKRYLKTPSWTFFMKNQLQTDAFVAFVKSLSSFLSTSSSSTAN